MPITTAAALVMSEEQRVELARMAASSVLPYRQVVQARALLWAGEGVANEEIARRSGVDSDTVRRWRKRFADTGTAGVGVIAKGRGASPGCRRARCRRPVRSCRRTVRRTGRRGVWRRGWGLA